jgi:hypothetical protein
MGAHYPYAVRRIGILLNHHTSTLQSERLLFYGKGSIFQLYHGENKSHFDKIMQCSLGWSFLVLAHRENSPRVETCLST